jgi:hypothetical protein
MAVRAYVLIQTEVGRTASPAPSPAPSSTSDPPGEVRDGAEWDIPYR